MAKIPCIPQARIFTLKETGETMSYDQVRQYLMSNPELWSGKGEAKAEAANTPEGIAARIRNKKQRGALSAIDFGISVTVYNGALEFMASQVEKGTKLGNAIANTIKWVDDKMKGEKWNKGAFGKYMNDTYKVTLGDGREVEVVRDDSKEAAEVINGWYQPIEQKILDSKEESLPANKWAERLKSKEDEDLWTGVRAFLEEKGTERVSRQEILDFIKGNRIEIVTAVKKEGGLKKDWTPSRELVFKKDGVKPTTGRLWENSGWKVIENTESDYSIFYPDGGQLEGSWESKEGAFDRVRMMAPEGTTKFSQYQLPGDKENYKEVLVTLPAKRSKVFGKISSTLDYARDEYGINSGEYKSVKKALENELEDDYGYSYTQIKELFDEYEKSPAVFKSSHYDEPNILVHLRMNLRTDADGNKVLFLEEVQSDWGQKGKKEGFFDEKRLRELDDKVGRGEKLSSKEEQELNELDAIQQSGRQTTPTAPFIMDTNAWVKLGLKTALKEAVAQGADKISWTTGEQQNDRYDLSKKIKFIDYSKNSDGTYDIGSDIEGTSYNDISLSRIEEIFGKDIAEKVQSETGVKSPINSTQKRLEGLDLKVGGKGMKGFYGSPSEGNLGIIGGVAEKLFGQKVGEVMMEGEPKPVFKIEDRSEPGQPLFAVIDEANPGEVLTIPETRKEAENWIKEQEKRWAEKSEKYRQFSISITPDLKAQVEKGLPLFGTTLSPEQKLKQAFNEWKAENNKLGITIDWKKLAESDKKFIKAVFEYIKQKINAAIEAGGKYSFEDFAKEYSKSITNFEAQKDKWQALYNKAAKGGVAPSVKAAVEQTTGVKRSTKTEVQRIIDKAFAIGSGVGFKEGVEKGTAQGKKAGLAAGKEAGFQKGFTKGATEGGKAGFVAGKEVGLQQGTEKGFTKGATEGMKAGAIEGRTQAVNMLRNALENLSGQLTPKQISAIVNRLGRLKTFSETTKQNFIDYANKVIEDANYIAKEKNATAIKKAVNQISKRTNIAANDQSLYKSFAALSVSHLTPSDLDKFTEWGTKIKTKALKPGDRAELASFIEQAQERQNAIVKERSEKMKEGRMRNLRAEFDEMQEAGTLPAGIKTFDEYVNSKKPKPKPDTLEAKIQAVEERLSEIPEGENEMIDRLRDADLSVLSKEDLILIDNSLYNYIDTGKLFGIGDPLSRADGLGPVKKAVEAGLKTRRQVDREDAEKLGMANFFTTIGGTNDVSAKLRALLIQPWLSAATIVNSEYIKAEKALLAKADKLSIKQANWNRIDLFGFLNEGEGNPDAFNALRDQKLLDLETLKNKAEENKDDDTASAEAQNYAYESLKAAIEKLGLNKNSTLESIRGKLSANELAFYNEMRKYLDQYSPKAIENMELYGNKEIGIVKNYWPRTTNKINEKQKGVDAFDLYGSENVGKNMFGREKGRSGLLGKSGYYTPIGQENYFNGLKETMLIAKAAHEYHMMQALYNTPDKGFNQLIKGQGANGIKELMIDWIMDTKNQGRYQGGVANVTADILNSIKKGYTSALINNPSQVVKQPTALGYTFMEAPEPFFKATGLVLQGMINGEDSRLTKAINGLFDKTTLGLRLYHPEMVELGEKYTIDKPATLRNIQQISKSINKLFGGETIAPMDAIVSQIATLTGYIQQAERSGKKFNIFEEQAKGYDIVAASAGEQMQAKTNNENAAIYYSKSQTKTKKNRAFYYLGNFQANSVRNLYISIRKIVSARTRQERKEGFQGVAGYLWSVALFNAAGMITSYGATAGAFYLYQQIMNALGDTEDDEEQRKRIFKYLDSKQVISAKRRLAVEAISMLTGAYGIFARAGVELILAAFEQAYYKTTEEKESLSDRIFFTPEVSGYAGVVADNIASPVEKTVEADDPQQEAMVQTALLANKVFGQSAFAFYSDNLLRAKNLVEKEARATKEDVNKTLTEKAYPNKEFFDKAKREWTKSVEQGDTTKAIALFNKALEYSPYILEEKNKNEEDAKKRIKYKTAIDLRESFYKDKVKPSVISDKDKFLWINYIFDGTNGDYMIGEVKLKDLVPASERQRYIDDYKRELAKIQKMASFMNKTIKAKNAYDKPVDWAQPFEWVKQVKDKLEKK